jgi:hypothetical protein
VPVAARSVFLIAKDSVALEALVADIVFDADFESGNYI